MKPLNPLKGTLTLRPFDSAQGDELRVTTEAHAPPPFWGLGGKMVEHCIPFGLKQLFIAA
jgi:hypothetical protein